jgi:hypothetical protein
MLFNSNDGHANALKRYVYNTQPLFFVFINKDSVFDLSKMPIEEKTNKTKHKQGNVPIQHNKEELMQHHTDQKAQTTRHHPMARLLGDTVDDAAKRQHVLLRY